MPPMKPHTYARITLVPVTVANALASVKTNRKLHDSHLR